MYVPLGFMSHLTTPMSILTKKVHFWSYLIKCHIDQVVKNVILIKWTNQKIHVTFASSGFSEIDQSFSQTRHGNQVGLLEKSWILIMKLEYKDDVFWLHYKILKGESMVKYANKGYLIF
jgi:hypothetical protein